LYGEDEEESAECWSFCFTSVWFQNLQFNMFLVYCQCYVI